MDDNLLPSRPWRAPDAEGGAGGGRPLGRGGLAGVVGLLDLPDDLLRAVAQRVMTGADGAGVRSLRPLLLTCRRLGGAAYSSVERLLVVPCGALDVLHHCYVPRPGAEALRVQTLAGAEMARRLSSLTSFLGRLPHFRGVELCDRLGACGPHARDESSRLWWGALLPALPRGRVSSLAARGRAVAALAATDAAFGPLRRLELIDLCARNVGHAHGASLVVARHQQTLEELSVARGCQHEASVGGAGVVDAWSVASLVGSLSRLPVLTALTLTCDLTSATAAAVAAACPALEGLTLLGNDTDGAWTTWTLPTALPLLSSLEWHVSDERFDPVDRSGFALMMRGRRLRRLVLRRAGTSTPFG